MVWEVSISVFVFAFLFGELVELCSTSSFEVCSTCCQWFTENQWLRDILKSYTNLHIISPCRHEQSGSTNVNCCVDLTSCTQCLCDTHKLCLRNAMTCVVCSKLITHSLYHYWTASNGWGRWGLHTTSEVLELFYDSPPFQSSSGNGPCMLPFLSWNCCEQPWVVTIMTISLLFARVVIFDKFVECASTRPHHFVISFQ